MDRHGNVTRADIEASLATNPWGRQAPGVLGVHWLPVREGILKQPALSRRIWLIAPAPPSTPATVSQPNRVQLYSVHPGHCRWRYRRAGSHPAACRRCRILEPRGGPGGPGYSPSATCTASPTRSSPWRWHSSGWLQMSGRASLSSTPWFILLVDRNPDSADNVGHPYGPGLRPGLGGLCRNVPHCDIADDASMPLVQSRVPNASSPVRSARDLAVLRRIASRHRTVIGSIYAAAHEDVVSAVQPL